MRRALVGGLRGVLHQLHPLSRSGVIRGARACGLRSNDQGTFASGTFLFHPGLGELSKVATTGSRGWEHHREQAKSQETEQGIPRKIK